MKIKTAGRIAPSARATLKSLLLLAALFLAGCKFDAPLTEKPARNVDTNLLGSWFSLVNGDRLDIYSLSPTEFLAVTSDGVPYVCTHSDLAGTNFVSCRYIGHDKGSFGKYAYVAYSFENGELIQKILADDLFPDDKAKSTPAEIRKTVEQALKAGKAFDADPEKQIRYRKKP